MGNWLFRNSGSLKRPTLFWFAVAGGFCLLAIPTLKGLTSSDTTQPDPAQLQQLTSIAESGEVLGTITTKAKDMLAKVDDPRQVRQLAFYCEYKREESWNLGNAYSSLCKKCMMRLAEVDRNAYREGQSLLRGLKGQNEEIRALISATDSSLRVSNTAVLGGNASAEVGDPRKQSRIDGLLSRVGEPSDVLTIIAFGVREIERHSGHVAAYWHAWDVCVYRLGEMESPEARGYLEDMLASDRFDGEDAFTLSEALAKCKQRPDK